MVKKGDTNMNGQTVKTFDTNLLGAAVKLAQARAKYTDASNRRKDMVWGWVADTGDTRTLEDVTAWTENELSAARIAQAQAEDDCLKAWKATALTRDQFQRILELGEQFVATVTDWDF
jgi:hypothetical protein